MKTWSRSRETRLFLLLSRIGCLSTLYVYTGEVKGLCDTEGHLAPKALLCCLAPWSRPTRADLFYQGLQLGVAAFQRVCQRVCHAASRVAAPRHLHITLTAHGRGALRPGGREESEREREREGERRGKKIGETRISSPPNKRGLRRLADGAGFSNLASRLDVGLLGQCGGMASSVPPK